MKVKDLIPELEAEIKKIEEDGDDACEVCTLYQLFYEKYQKLVTEEMQHTCNQLATVVVPLCPKCNKPLHSGTSYGYTEGVVGGSNSIEEKEEMQYCQLWHCTDCDQDYAMMPIPIEWNANHDILYTGGSCYLTDDDESLLVSKIKERMRESIEQFVERVKDPKIGRAHV